MSTLTRLGSVAATAILAIAVAGCGGDEDGTAGHSVLAEQGKDVANSAGCSACHGTDGRGGGVGPSWDGLAGSTVVLQDGSEVVADTAYLQRAIVDPSAEVRAGYTIQMPVVELSDAEVGALIAYIEEIE